MMDELPPSDLARLRLAAIRKRLAEPRPEPKPMRHPPRYDAVYFDNIESFNAALEAN